jgi:hypothetical protein
MMITVDNTTTNGFERVRKFSIVLLNKLALCLYLALENCLTEEFGEGGIAVRGRICKCSQPKELVQASELIYVRLAT